MHREAPLIELDAKADATDTFIFVSAPDTTDRDREDVSGLFWQQHINAAGLEDSAVSGAAEYSGKPIESLFYDNFVAAHAHLTQGSGDSAGAPYGGEPDIGADLPDTLWILDQGPG